jgi:hypothetical protein
VLFVRLSLNRFLDLLFGSLDALLVLLLSQTEHKFRPEFALIEVLLIYSIFSFLILLFSRSRANLNSSDLSLK